MCTRRIATKRAMIVKASEDASPYGYGEHYARFVVGGITRFWRGFTAVHLRGVGKARSRNEQEFDEKFVGK